MIDTLLNSELVADGEIVKIERDLDGLRLKCRDGSGCRLNHVRDNLGMLWVLDIWTATEEVINIAATTKAAANAVWIEVADEGQRWALIYDVLFMMGCLIRYGWWVYSLIIWDDEREELKVVHRDEAATKHVVIDIAAVGGRRWEQVAAEEGC